MSAALIPIGEERASYQELSKQYAASDLAPEGLKKAVEAYVVMCRGRELGIPPLASVELIKVIKGRTVISPELMLAMVIKAGAKIKYTELTDKSCTVEASRPNGLSGTFTFNLEDAKKADLLRKDNWQKYPRAMLRSRCIAEMCRSLFPDIILGASYTPEELEDVQQATPDTKPRKAKKEPAKAEEKEAPKALPEPKEETKEVVVEVVEPIRPAYSPDPALLAKIAASFEKVGVYKVQVEEYIGRPMAEFTEDDIAALRKIREAIADNPQATSFFFKGEE